MSLRLRSYSSRSISPRAYELIPATPPTGLSYASFDLVFAHSVFTHLTEESQFAWPSQLRDLLKPDGLCCVTVMAELAWFSRHGPTGRPVQLARFLADGYLDEGHIDVGVDSLSPGAYRSTHHTLEYIQREWSKYMRIEEIIHGFADLQTLIVLRRVE